MRIKLIKKNSKGNPLVKNSGNSVGGVDNLDRSSNLNIGNIATEKGLDNAVRFARTLMTKYDNPNLAFALAGVGLDENNFDPTAYCYDGGEGFLSLTGDSKNYYWDANNIPHGTPIWQEDLDLLSRHYMNYMNHPSVLNYYDAIMRAPDLEGATATATALAGGIGFVPLSSWSNYVKPEDLGRLILAYKTKNGGIADNMYERRLEGAKRVRDAYYQKYGDSKPIDIYTLDGVSNLLYPNEEGNYVINHPTRGKMTLSPGALKDLALGNYDNVVWSLNDVICTAKDLKN